MASLMKRYPSVRTLLRATKTPPGPTSPECIATPVTMIRHPGRAAALQAGQEALDSYGGRMVAVHAALAA